MAEEKNTQFNYLLNAVEHAASEAHPAKAGYAGKRKALMAHVRELERKAAAYDATTAAPAPLPLMQGALRTTVSCGPDGLYEMRFRFESPAALHAADTEWRAYAWGMTGRQCEYALGNCRRPECAGRCQAKAAAGGQR